ncbi:MULTISPECIES: hypothetical protein [unclassified Crossiella]|uniref:hypothetical protein n=1 Tax=unclassified Crossiella TaxID=2620835 RepID=UPI001FFE56F6|nr:MULTISPECIES: hypothetical protein [unclassified Crossiella]MCK2242033.1 hypothetical protein [Crossiella sp. S99.2]MCK2255936.1 hypothetical protein [Crossiella sp. S99.1]
MTQQNLWLADVDGNLVRAAQVVGLSVYALGGYPVGKDAPGEVTLRADLAATAPDGSSLTRTLTAALPFAVVDELRRHLVQQLARLGESAEPVVLRVELKDNVIRWTVDRFGARPEAPAPAPVPEAAPAGVPG